MSKTLWHLDAGKIIVDPHSGQMDILTATQRYIAAIAGTGGGKTSLGCIWLAQEIQKNPSGDFLVVSPNFRMLSRVVIPMLTDLFIKTLHCAEHRKVEGVFLLETGGRILLGSADKPLSLEGAHVHAVWLDEAGQMDALVWDVSQRRVGLTQGRILITTTPYAWNWLKFEVTDRFDAGDTEYYVKRYSSIMNPSYSKSEYEKQKAKLPAWKFSMFYDGQWAKPEGLIYEVSPENIIEPFDVPDTWPWRVGLDWGVNAPTAAVWVAESPEGIFYAADEFERSGLMPDESALMVMEQTAQRKVITWMGDGAGIGSVVWIEKFRNAGMPVRGSRATVISRIMATSSLFREGRLRVFRTCRNLLGEIGGYSWKMRKIGGQDREIIDEPRKENDHLCLAAGTMIATARGLVPIECVHVDDMALTRCGYYRVMATCCTNLSAEVVRVEFSHATLVGTPEHPIYLRDGTTYPLGNLTPGMLAWWSEVRGVYSAPRQPVYNLTVEGEHEYFANGILCRNCDSLSYSLLTTGALQELPPGLDALTNKGRWGNVLEEVQGSRWKGRF